MILSWREACLIAGVSEADFWNMTIGEAIRAYEAYQERRRDAAYMAYTNAMTVGWFIGAAFGGRRPPTMEDVYPELFKKEPETAPEPAADEQKMKKSVVNFINFANNFNRRYEEHGNREPESQNNG